MLDRHRRAEDLVETIALTVLGAFLLVYAWVFAAIPAVLLIRRRSRLAKVCGWVLAVLVVGVAVLILTNRPPR